MDKRIKIVLRERKTMVLFIFKFYEKLFCDTNIMSFCENSENYSFIDFVFYDLHIFDNCNNLLFDKLIEDNREYAIKDSIFTFLLNLSPNDFSAFIGYIVQTYLVKIEDRWDDSNVENILQFFVTTAMKSFTNKYL